MNDIAALSAEAGRRGTSYGKLMALTTESERREIVKQYREKAAAGVAQCKGCLHRRGSVCNCLVDTGRRKVTDGAKCLSREAGERKKKKVCELATTDKTTLAGYQVRKRR